MNWNGQQHASNQFLWHLHKSVHSVARDPNVSITIVYKKLHLTIFFNLKPQCKWHFNRRAKILLTRQFKWCLMKEKSSHFESCHFGLNIKRQQNEHRFHHFNQCNQNFHRMTVSESFSVNIFTPFLNPTRGFNLKRHFRKRGRAPKL